MKKYAKAITLIELIVALSIFMVISLVVFNIGLFSRYQVASADRHAQLQNELAYALEHMSNNVLRGVGYPDQPAIEPLATNDGFRVRVDLNPTPTPQLADDTWVSYTLAGNTLSCSLNAETLSRNIFPGSPADGIPGVAYAAMPQPSLPATPSGFYIDITNSGAVVGIGLVARAGGAAGENLQVSMQMTLYSRNSSAR